MDVALERYAVIGLIQFHSQCVEARVANYSRINEAELEWFVFGNLDCPVEKYNCCE